MGSILRLACLVALAVSSYNPGGRGPSDAIAYPNIYQVFGSQASSVIARMDGNLTNWATSQSGSALNTAALQTIYGIQRNLIVNGNAPVVELFFDSGYPE